MLGSNFLFFDINFKILKNENFFKIITTFAFQKPFYRSVENGNSKSVL